MNSNKFLSNLVRMYASHVVEMHSPNVNTNFYSRNLYDIVTC
jgi:hypothetical protein